MNKPKTRKAGPYVLQVNAPAAADAAHWDYPAGYFPRKFHYVVEAEECAKQAIRNGATMARIEGPNGIELDFKPLPPQQHLLSKDGKTKYMVSRDFPEEEIQCAPFTKLRQGDHVWVAYAYEQRDGGGIKSSVSERIFEKAIPNYCDSGEERWVLVMPGRPFGLGYGCAYKPEGVHRTRDEAVIAQRAAISEKINAWREALDRAF